MNNFKFELGDIVKDGITGHKGVIVCRSQWIHNCNTYGIQPQELKDGKPVERQHFDEPQLVLVKSKVIKEKRDTGGPSKPVSQTNR